MRVQQWKAEAMQQSIIMLPNVSLVAQPTVEAPKPKIYLPCVHGVTKVRQSYSAMSVTRSLFTTQCFSLKISLDLLSL
jgi:hypothetical protein